MVANGSTGLAQRDELGVRGGVGVGDVAVPAPAHYAAFADDDRADRNFSGFERAPGAAERFLHPEFVLGRLPRSGLGSWVGSWVVGLRTVACGGISAGHLD